METEDLFSKSSSPVIEVEEEELQNVIESTEPRTCCRCGNVVSCNQVFEIDGCTHLVCVRCRFRDCVPCKLCHPVDMPLTSSAKEETLSQKISLDEVEEFHFPIKKKINKDHIINVDWLPEDVTSGEIKQFCTVCQRIFKKSNSSYHYGCMSGEKPYSCVECDRQFAKKAHMESHLNTHYGIKPFRCTFHKCKASFTVKDKLIRHMKIHEKEAKHFCPICKKPYTTTATLNIHLENVHSSLKAFQCDLCPRNYKYRKSLKIHKMMKHQGIRDHMCEICGKKYALYAQLKLHTRSHVMYHRRPHKCRQLPTCNKRFMTRRDRTRHELIHITSHDFECSLCNTTFGRKDNLERHMKNFHQDVPQTLSENPKSIVTVFPFNIKSGSVNNKQRKVDTNKTSLSRNSKQVKIQPKFNLKKKKIDSKSKDAKKKTSNRRTDYQQCKISTFEQNSNNMQPENQLIKNSTPSVIVSPKPPEIQNRPSVIKSIPKLLPYRVLPPDERFLNLTEERFKGKNVSDQLRPPLLIKDTASKNNQQCVTSYYKNAEINSCVQLSKSNEIAAKTSGSKEKQTMLKAHKRKSLNDEALNRSYRIIHHTDTISTHKLPAEKPTGQVERLEVDKESVLNLSSSSGDSGVRIGTNSFVFTDHALPLNERPTHEMIEYVIEESFNRIRTCDSTRAPQNSEVNCTSDPGMDVTLAVNNCGLNHGDHLTLTESYSSYASHFEHDCLKGRGNGLREENVEHLLPNDFEMGFQYINEQFSYAEMNLSQESRVVRICFEGN
uniref:C2H2-type domain-containing protein n=1 Tax=Homalodisca liturata TaxID=320908 RepID=A0A1B6IUI3_9HEMI